MRTLLMVMYQHACTSTSVTSKYPADELQAIKVLNMIKLFGKAIRVNKASQDKDTLDVGANLFIGNLDPDVDEKVCCHSSSRGTLIQIRCFHCALRNCMFQGLLVHLFVVLTQTCHLLPHSLMWERVLESSENMVPIVCVSK